MRDYTQNYKFNFLKKESTILFLMIILFKKRTKASELSLELIFAMTNLCGIYHLVFDDCMIKLYNKIFKLEKTSLSALLHVF